jgi:hypothetical protein
MSNGLNVESLQSLEELETLTARFSSEMQEGIAAIERQIQRKMEQLDQIVADRHRAVAEWQSTYDGADEEEDDVGFIQRKLAEAEDNLRHANQWQRRLEEAYAEYGKHARLANYLADEHSAKARAFLKERTRELYDYVELKPDLSGGMAESSPSHQPVFAGPASDAMETTVVSVVSAGEAAAFEMGRLLLPKGFGWIRLDELRPDEMAELPAERDYRKNDLSEADMREGLQLLQTRILPEIQTNPAAATRDYFSKLDAAESRSGSKSLAKIFDAYFGQSDHIWVDRFKGDQFFGIGNGRHRIKAAHDLGWSAVPARIIEVDRR